MNVVYIYVTAEITIRGNHYSFFIFVFATGHQIRPTNLIFGMKAQCYLDRAMTKKKLILFLFDAFNGHFPLV